jgi:hypothetical protein
MRTNREHVTMDGNEAKLLDRYEAQFGETPPIAFLDPQTSKRLMMDAIRNIAPSMRRAWSRTEMRKNAQAHEAIMLSLYAMVPAIVVEKWKSSAWPRKVNIGSTASLAMASQDPAMTELPILPVLPCRYCL